MAEEVVERMRDATAEDLVGADRRRAALSSLPNSVPFSLHRASYHAVNQRQHLQPPAGRSG
jgi:hypothetical protein